MHTVQFTADEVDDLLYFTRGNEAQELQQTISELAQKYGCTAREVLEACKDPETSNTVLHFSSANGFADLLQSLVSTLKAGDAPPSLINAQNREGNTPLHWAAYNGHLAVVKSLVESGADMWIKNAAGHLAMFEAERADKNGVVQYLLEAGGRKVEEAGREGAASGEDEVEVQDGDVVAGPSRNGTAERQAESGVEVEMGEAGPS